MKKLLPYLFLLIGTQAVYSQCAIDSTIQSPGFYPDTGSFLKPGCVGSQYEEVIQIYVPTTVSVAIGTYPVEYVQLDSVPDFPADLHYSTNPASGKLNGGERGCISIYGQLNAAPGDYKFTIHYTAVFLFNGSPIPLNLLAPYKLHVDTGTKTYFAYADSACSNRGYYFGGNWLSSTGTYNDTMSNSAGCDSVIALSLYIRNFDTTVTVSGDTLMAPAGYTSYTFIACGTQTILQSGTNNWFICQPGNAYTVSMANAWCSDTASCTVFSGIASLTTESIRAWPNPVREQLNLQFTTTDKREIYLYNANGQLVQSSFSNASAIKLNMGQYPDGIYLLTVNSPAGNSRIKIFKEK